MRDELGKKGVVIDIDLLQLPQGVITGGEVQKEDAVEMYYNAAITSWLTATLDLQIINTALKKTLDSSGQLQDVNTAVLAGLRLYARF